MAPPKKVEDQGKRAERLQQEFIAGKTAAPDEVPPVEEEPAATPVVEEGKKIEQEVKPVVTPGPEGEHFKQKYQVLQAKYDAEVPRLFVQIDTLTKLLEEQGKTIDHLSGQAAQTVAETQEIVPERKDFEPDNYESYGPEIVELVEGFNELKEENKALKSGQDKIVSTTDEIITATAATSEAQMFTQLDGLVSDWQTINQSPKWLNWLGLADPMSGMQRQVLLDNALKAFDATRVANIITSFKIENDIPLQVPEKAPEKPDGEKEETQIILPETAAPSEVDDVGKSSQQITAQDVAKAAKLVQRGRMKEAEFYKLSNAFQEQLARQRAA